MPHEHLFAAHTVWTGASSGPVEGYEGYSREYTIEVEGKPSITASSAPAFRGDASLPNPEDLLLAALSGCHLLSYLAICARRGIAVIAYEDRCTATMAFQDGRMRFIEAMLRPVVTIRDPDDAERAQQAHDPASEQCFIASSVNFPVRHEPVVQLA